jgi:hypothetical protein
MRSGSLAVRVSIGKALPRAFYRRDPRIVAPQLLN